MQLHVGERLEGAGPESQPGGYVVTGVVHETPWHALYTGKKVLYNFDFTAKRLRETDEVEWLDVFLRTIRYPLLDDASYVRLRRTLARSEVRQVLGNRRSNLWPEAIDLLEVENVRDPFACTLPPHDLEPIAIFARPHGRFVADWQQQVLPLNSILSVLAELLEFVHQAHDDGLLLQGLGPGAILIDGSDRVHYLGSDLALAIGSPLLGETTAAREWGRLFPSERLPHGFVAPECVQPGLRPDSRSDLYAWGALVYALITGDDPGRLAREQGQPWAMFHEEHFAQIELVLRQLTADSIRAWAEQLDVPADRLLADWPGNVVDALRLVLDGEPNRRPRSVLELRSWLVDLPPPAVAALVPVHLAPDVARLLLDCTGLDTQLQLRVQASADRAPAHPLEGVTVYDGPLRPSIDVSLGPQSEATHFSAFTCKASGDQLLYSTGIAATLWEPNAVHLRAWAEQAAVVGSASAPPPRIAMVLSALDPGHVADSLLASARPRVRGWALWRLDQGLRSGFPMAAAEPFLWRLVRDPSGSLRQAAGVSLWQRTATTDDTLLMKLLETLDTAPVDAPVPLASFLEHLGIPTTRAAELLRRLEHSRPLTCPVCGAAVTIGERAFHLRAAHGYLEFGSEVLPIETVRARLWEQAFYQRERGAHQRLVELYAGEGEAGLVRYLGDLDKQLVGAQRLSATNATALPVALPFAAYAEYVALLRTLPEFPTLTRLLLQSPRGRLREVGREALVPVLAERLRAPGTSAADVWHALEQACPGMPGVAEKLVLCDRLAMLGVDQAAVSGCAARLREERLVVCPECKGEVLSRDLEIHLRRAHDVHEFRGVRGSYAEIRTAILDAVCTAPPDPAAWRSLESLLADRHPEATDRHRLVWFQHQLKGMDAEQRGPAIVALAEGLVAHGRAGALLPHLVAAQDASGQGLRFRLALEIVARLHPPIPREIVTLIKPLLADRELPRRSRENAVLGLLRSAGKAGPAAHSILEAYVAGSGKLRAINKLQQLEQRFGQAPAIEELLTEIDAQVRMTCPRCPTQLRKKDMVQHLWERHHLVLDGQRVREPWRVLDDWVVDYGLEKDAGLLLRCRELAVRDDPENGLQRLQRLLYRHGIREPAVLSELIAEARRQQATLCPHCFGLVPVSEPARPEPLRLRKKRLEGHGYRVELSERGLVPELEIEAPEEILYQGREPGRGLTRLGCVMVVIGPLVVLTYLLLEWRNGWALPAGLAAALAGGLGLILTGMVYLTWPSPPRRDDRLVRSAWRLLVPVLIEEQPGPEAWAFLQGLAELSEREPPGSRSVEVLATCCEAFVKPARSDPRACMALAALTRLLALDLRAEGQDEVAFAVGRAAQVFEGNLPLPFLPEFLKVFLPPQRWDLGRLTRFQVLLAQRAFLAEVEFDDWLALGRAFPEIAPALGLDRRGLWAQRHALWADRNRRPWEQVAPALSVYELAEKPEDSELLERYPDLLLYATKSGVIVGTKGIWYQGICIGSYAEGTKISWIRTEDGAGYELVVGSQHIPCTRNPRDAIDEIEAWLRFYFLDFAPRVPADGGDLHLSSHRMWQGVKAACPACSRALVPCPGDVGLAVRT